MASGRKTRRRRWFRSTASSFKPLLKIKKNTSLEVPRDRPINVIQQRHW